ncbi:MAG TPA: hypothetical protein VMB21_19560 [Candidatus Limnocylindria bacterium]|nr:hypothetical protein [Candidatus Limnocylindria bacterium]
MKQPFNPSLVPLNYRIQVEPALRDSARGKTPDQLQAMARIFYRWAKQVRILEAALRRDSEPTLPNSSTVPTKHPLVSIVPLRQN